MKRFGLVTTLALCAGTTVCSAQTPAAPADATAGPVPAAPSNAVVEDPSLADFTVTNIRIEGLQRISEGTVYNYLPVNIGDHVTPARIREAVRSLYSTGFFRDVQMRRDGGTLAVLVVERPAIESFEITGNKDLKTEDLQKSLRNVGLAAGKTFDRSVLEEVKGYLTDTYFNRGKYAVSIDEKVEDDSGNRVKIKITIKEGSRAKIRTINIVGNHVYTDKEIGKTFELQTPNWLSWYKQDDRYSSESLTGDQEKLRSFYMDRGYANFQIESTQVAIAPEKDDIFITLNIDEGGVYKVGDVKLAGSFPVPKAELERLILVTKGEIYSRKFVTATQELIQNRLGQDGYAFAKVDPVPTTDKATGIVAITFFVDPGNRVYVRNITFSGAKRINDEVLRREMRILEGGWLSNVGLDRSKQRLQRLPYITKVDSETTPVPGSADQVDVDYKIEEGPGASLSGGVGYSETYKFELNGNYTDSNFLGSGQRVALNLSAGEFNKVYSLSETNPYTNVDNLTRTYNFSYRDSSQFTSSSSDFSTKILTFGESFGYPLSEYQFLNAGYNLQGVQLVAIEGSSALQSLQWVQNNGHTYKATATGLVFDPTTATYAEGEYALDGTRFAVAQLLAGWSYDSRNRGIFPDRGMHQTISFSYTPPITGVSYYKANYEFLKYLPLFGKWVFAFTGDVGYGGGLGKTQNLPPYELFYGGGPDSVRGYRESDLGPKDQYGNPYGGNLNVLARSELIVPMPPKIASSARVSLFVDVGNVFSTGKSPQFYAPPGTPTNPEYSIGNVTLQDLSNPAILTPISYGFAFSRLKESVGVSVQWLAPLGLFRFSLAVPLNAKRELDGVTWGDQTERFQFSVGQAFSGGPGTYLAFKQRSISAMIPVHWFALGFAHERNIVKRVVRSLILGSAATLVLAAAPAWADMKIGYVNYNALLQDSPDAKVIADALRNEFLPRQRELQNLQQSIKTREDKLTKDGATMTDDQRAREDKDIRDEERELQRKQSEAQDDLNTRRNEELSTLQKSLVEKVRAFAKTQNFDLILADGVIWATPTLDITQQVLASLNASAPKAAPAAPKPASK